MLKLEIAQSKKLDLGLRAYRGNKKNITGSVKFLFFLENTLKKDFLRRSAVDRSCQPTADESHDCIINYKPAGTQTDPQYREFAREFDGRVLSGQFIRSAIAGNIPLPLYPCDTNIITVRHFIETSTTVVHSLRIYYNGI